VARFVPAIRTDLQTALDKMLTEQDDGAGLAADA
jgi:hypothetical protein